MAEGAQPVEIDPDFEPLSRPRSCTWPLPRPENLDPGNSNTSSPAPSLQQEPGGNGEYISNLALLEEHYDEYAEEKPPVSCSEYQGSRTLHHHPPPPQQQQQLLGPQLPPQQQVPPPVTPLGGPCSISQRKSSSSRRNAWGNMSYADLITKAIESSPEKRLTLSQIYEWMVKSVAYFKDKGDSNSSAGWKNSIRHNLSLHSRFVRIQNEGTGKSSWWMLNPEGGKNGKSPRRRAASMDNNSKFSKSRGRASKKKMAVTEVVDGRACSPGSHYSHWLGSPNSQSNEDLDSWSTFRTRTSSDASTLSGRRSPFPSEQDDVGEPDMHMGYPLGPKITSTLPGLSEVTRSMAQRGSENVMESLLDNLNLLSPPNPQLASVSPHSSNAAMLQNSPYSSSNRAQDYHKSMYSQVKMNPLPPVPLQTLPESKAGFGAYENCFNCPPGLHKGLLSSDADTSRDALVTQGGRRGCLMSPYNSQNHARAHNEVKLMSSSQSHTVCHVSPQSLQSPGPLPTQDLNSFNMIPLTSVTGLAGGPPRMSSLRTSTQLTHRHPARSNNVMFANISNGYTELALIHPRGHHQERLPSDLDNMSIERFECDMESVLHDTLMDGGALDFNFEPAAGAQGFPPRGKNTSHSWVSG